MKWLTKDTLYEVQWLPADINKIRKLIEQIPKIKEKFQIEKQLLRIKRIANPLSVYTDFLDVPFERLSEEEREEYKKLNEKSISVYITC